MDNTNTPSAEKEAEVRESKNFIEHFIEEDLENLSLIHISEPTRPY